MALFLFFLEYNGQTKKRTTTTKHYRKLKIELTRTAQKPGAL